ncbi:biotin--[acetyl-CoA-carboxylase] ligase [Wenzhouxiangella marina]|uniref:Bifunctional ligase/repressor BirA n=1 Tax=Wenzhouxiangella marina TaxID=1579979 RepID=A0A0K0XZR5_9GAMM|nr:biotin--[acetyl-CoA-carboxylase] ligase [Wenzhouxiangella marina]AKS43174.1 biotin--acetyl-CoA-carboxylase ligase [Wenzhouxiangella marina]MBB6087141.1 BirA family biotin operon repressor/biotin-[acetyl-CoA-carboxylase] ligase [Wenzhouxiangella marina]
MNPLLARLADGQCHSGEDLARELQISRAAIWKRIEALRALGLNVQARAGGGYQLERPFDGLDAERIRSQLGEKALPVEVRFQVDSTNACLQRERREHAPPRALLAEVQTAGRGRRGRPWISPPGAGLYLSMSWRFDCGLSGLSTLSLATGVAAARLLEAQGIEDLGLKWPNDLVCDQGKLGGCLIEVQGSAEGPCEAIVGIGINVRLDRNDSIDQAWTDLHRLGWQGDRNALAAGLIQNLADAFAALDRSGFESFADDWRRLDFLQGKTVRIEQSSRAPLEGRAAGIDELGRLLIDTATGRQAVGSGDVRVRAI